MAQEAQAKQAMDKQMAQEAEAKQAMDNQPARNPEEALQAARSASSTSLLSLMAQHPSVKRLHCLDDLAHTFRYCFFAS